MMTTDVISVENLHGFYGESHVLHGIGLMVRKGEVVTFLGRNGAGKTTTLRAIMGLLRDRRGSIRIYGKETVSLPPNRIARLGVGYVPEERGIFANLSVLENLLLPPAVGASAMTLVEIYSLFPHLQERAASQGTRLSGGEQQMLAIARVLRAGPQLLLLDEPTEGLAPVVINQIGETIRRIREHGLTILLVEQNFRFAARIADRHLVMENGRLVDALDRAELHSNKARLQKYLGV